MSSGDDRRGGEGFAPTAFRRFAYCLSTSADDAHDVGFFHDQQLLAVALDFCAGPFAEKPLVALLRAERRHLAGLGPAAWPEGDDLALLRLLLGGVRDDDAAFRLFLAFEAADDDAVMQGTELHVLSFLSRLREGPVGSGRFPLVEHC